MRRRTASFLYGPLPEGEGIAAATLVEVPICRVQLVRESTRKVKQTVNGPGDAASILSGYLAGVDREHFVILMLDTQNQVLGIHTVSIGTLTAAHVTGREVFKAAILANAASIIAGHNHPSGDPTPSPEDLHITTVLAQAGKLLDIELLDHIVVGVGKSFVSLKRNGSWPTLSGSFVP